MLADDEVPLSGPAKRRLYAQLGGYEASKREGDATLRAEVTGSGLPLTLVNPSTVIGHATTPVAPRRRDTSIAVRMSARPTPVLR